MTAVQHTIAEGEHPHHVIVMQQPETAKNIHVYLNGDKFYPGRKFVLNRRHIADFDGFLNQVTSSSCYYVCCSFFFLVVFVCGAIFEYRYEFPEIRMKDCDFCAVLSVLL